jgi:hypothetical protein
MKHEAGEGEVMEPGEGLREPLIVACQSPWGVYRAGEPNEGPASHDVTEAAAATPHHLQSEDD